jgi:integrase
MSVRKRTWTTAKGVKKEAWIVDYVDQKGGRHIKTFDKKKEADAFTTTMRVEVRDGTHTAYSESPTVAEAGTNWLAATRAAGLEKSTIDEYERHLDMHIVPSLGRLKLAELNAPLIRDFEDKLRAGTAPFGEDGTETKVRSQAMTKKIIGSLGALLADAVERGGVARNVVYDLRSKRRLGKERRAERRQKGKLKVGVDIPTPAEIKAIVEAAEGRWRPFLMTAVLTGLRASELRGLRWEDVDLKKADLHVRQRADRYQEIGKPKTEAGDRTVPLPSKLLAVLREWKLKCPGRDTGNKDAKGKPIRELHLVFPNADGKIDWHTNIIQRGLIPTMIAAGVTTIAKDGDGNVIRDEDGKPVMAAKYTGLHALRHFYASWCINRKVDGGLELPAKVVQERLGHSSITVTLDTYGHLFPRGDDADELAAAETALLG